jgi:hypothetical protein
MKIDECIFDSNIHDWSINNSIFNKKIEGRSNLAFVIEDKDGNIFGICLGETPFTMNKLPISFYKPSSHIGVFSLESYGRIESSELFKIKPDSFNENISYYIYEDNSEVLITIDYIKLMKIEINRWDKTKCICPLLYK